MWSANSLWRFPSTSDSSRLMGAEGWQAKYSYSSYARPQNTTVSPPRPPICSSLLHSSDGFLNAIHLHHMVCSVLKLCAVNQSNCSSLVCRVCLKNISCICGTISFCVHLFVCSHDYEFTCLCVLRSATSHNAVFTCRILQLAHADMSTFPQTKSSESRHKEVQRKSEISTQKQGNH